MITINLIIDKRRPKKDNTYPLVFRVTSNSSSRDIATGYSVLEANWNIRTKNLKETHPTYEIIAPRIKELELKYLSRIIEFEKAYPAETDIQKIKDFIVAIPIKTLTVYKFWLEEIKQMKQSKRFGNARVNEFTLAVLHNVKSLDLSFEELNYAYLKHVEVTLLGRGVKVNSIGVYFRSLRAVYNSAIKNKMANQAHYPFGSYKIKKGATTPRVLLLSELQSYFKLNLPQNSFMFDSWLIGKLMFMLIGINFKDLIILNEENIKGDRLIYKRAKTKKLYSIKLLPEVINIINYFKGRDVKTLLGKLSIEELNNEAKFPLIIRQKNKVFNNHLTRIGKIISTKEEITSYVFRYTWANIAKQRGYSKDLIAEALGHEYGNKVTGIYLEAYDKELIDDMNQKIYDAIMED